MSLSLPVIVYSIDWILTLIPKPPGASRHGRIVRRSQVFVWLLVGAFGCSPAAEPPELRRVVPAFGWTGEITSVTLVGQDLFPEVVVGDQKGEAQFNSSFQVFLQTDPPTSLDAVEFVDASTLTAQVPAAVAPGFYDVQVVTPSGQIDLLELGFQVTETRADHLVFDVDTVGFDVTQTASVGMHVADPEGGNVAQPILIELRADSEQDAAGVQFSDGLLDNQVSLSDGVGVRGNLHADGTATLLLQSSVAQDLTLTLSAVEEPSIISATTLLSFFPGVPNHVIFSLPSENFTTVAGEEVLVGIEVVDAAGNAIDATGLQIGVFEDSGCGELRQIVDLLQAGPYPLILTTACTDNHLHAFGIGIDQAESDAFDVLAGPMAVYGVVAAPSSVIAGQGVLAVQVTAQDGYGNSITDHSADVALHDSLGGLDRDAGVGSQTCDPFEGGQTVCTATPIRAGNGITITAADDSGFTGLSNPISVTPDSAVAVTMTLGVAAAEAGVPFTIGLQLVDQWDNAIAFAAESALFEDSTGTLACTPSADGNYLCIVTASDDSDVINVDLLGLLAVSPPFPVTNTDLGLADVTVTETSVVAGQSLGATVRGFDNYGNAYTTAVSGSLVSLVDALGGMAPLSLTLDSAGSGTGTVTLTVAGEDALIATASGITLGQSSPITVGAGTVSALRVTAPAWADIGAGVPVDVSAVDAWGNASASYAGTVNLSMTGCTGASTSGFDGGMAEVELACQTPAFGVDVTVDDGALSATSEPLDLLDFDCPDGPTADLALNGSSVVVACLVSGQASLVVDASGSVAGGSSLVVWHLDGESNTRSTASPTSLVYESVGGRAVSLVVADADGCASEDWAEAWVGENDGSATGPITVTPGASSVPNGASTTVDIEATDCAGDVAAGANVYAWSSLGDIGGATSTGTGLAVALDGAGTGIVTLAFDAGYEATATISASSADGSAFGAADLSVTDDGVLPAVLAVTPYGVWLDVVDVITIEFSEAMRLASITTSTVTLAGPAGAVSSTVELSGDGRTLTVTPTSAVDPTTGTFTLGLSTNVRDVAGNRLSGDWSGTAAAWSSTFGAVASTVESTGASCSWSAVSFRPDGDDGALSEADTVSVTLAAATSPAWWALSVIDADAAFVRRTQVEGAGSVVVWDGRGDDGVVRGEGTYSVSVSPVDEAANTGSAADGSCLSSITLKQHGRAP